VEAEREGREARYRLTDPDVMLACDIMRGVLERRLRRLAALSETATNPTSQATTSSPVATASS
jgi:hypothetical protein